MRKACVTLSGLILSFMFALPSLSLANQPGKDWLADQARPDGGVYSPGDLAISYQSTLEALSVRLLAGDTLQLEPAALAGFVAATTGSDTELLATKVIAGTLTADGEQIASLLSARQNPDGGFGALPSYQSTPFDTY
ncbi:MAG: hypothetical protein ACK5ME_03835 [Parahaliea sp.]